MSTMQPRAGRSSPGSPPSAKPRAVPPRAAPRPTSTTTPRFSGRGVDVSKWQGKIDWPKVAGSGISFSYIKASEALGADSRYFENAAGAKAAGLKIGAYHFFRPGVDPLAQARNFAAKVKAAGAFDLPPAVDVEVPGGISAAQYTSRLRAMLGEVNRLTGAKPVIYTSPGFFNSYLKDASLLRDYGVWGAQWGSKSAPNIGGVPPVVWQYGVGAAGTVPGISTRIDLDIVGPAFSLGGEAVPGTLANPQPTAGRIAAPGLPSATAPATFGTVRVTSLPSATPGPSAGDVKPLDLASAAAAAPASETPGLSSAIASGIAAGFAKGLTAPITGYAEKSGLSKLTVTNVAVFAGGVLLVVIGLIWAAKKGGATLGEKLGTENLARQKADAEKAIGIGKRALAAGA